ncbi:MAG: hypothetical protein KF910_10690 [Brevundimonas sp.]|uniref:hypothetical protein n=1 Tax=Brevundimonas sp. TaxID=1871086 RepID=UPI0025B852E1|nr:hypothetical protein [Brevundimonas sp.]MBX3478068.1 hypothetical protein [Brevundimonas sp.]
MSQHNIVGSEAFGKRPHVYIRSMKPGGRRRRQARVALAFIAGVGVAAVGGVVAAVVAFGPGLAGG